MPTSYPGALDALTNPSGGDLLSASHPQQHANANDAIEAIQGALGVNPQGSAASVAARLAGVTLSSGSDLTGLAPGLYVCTNRVIAGALGLPGESPGVLTASTLGGGSARTQTYVTWADLSGVTRLWVRERTAAGTWLPWREIAGHGDTSGPPRRELLQQALLARKGGRIGTGGKGAIAMRFDDAHADFRTKVLPLLEARRLPYTRVSTSDSISGVAIDPAEWAPMQTYCIATGGEVWNHGRTHLDATTEPVIEDELIGALTALRGYLPRLPVDCFAPPGGSSIAYDGHMPSTAVANWADTYAGQRMLGHHALCSGYYADTYYRPLDGILRDGQIHYSCDPYNQATAKTLVDRARDWQVGVVMMWHGQNVDTAGNMTLSDLTAVLDYIVAERDAGNILVLTVSGLAVADKSTAWRHDLLTVSTGSPSYSASLLYPQFRQGVLGSTRELVATVAGTVGATVTSTIGESSRAHTIPAGGSLSLRHVVTIPTDLTTTLTVSISGGTSCTGVHLYAV